MDGGPVGTDVWIKYIGDSLWGYQSTDERQSGNHEVRRDDM